MWFLALLGLVYHNSESSTLHVTVPSGTVRHYEHTMAESTSWVIEFTDQHGVLVFSSDGDCEIYLGVYSSTGSATEWYTGDGSTSGVISMGDMWGTVEIFSKSNATAMFTACYLGDPEDEPGVYSEIRPFSSGSYTVEKMSKGTQLGFVVVGPNVTVSMDWIQEPPDGLKLHAYGWDSPVPVGANRTFTPGAVWMLELATEEKVTPELRVTFEGDSDVSFSNVTFEGARDKFGMFQGNSFVEFARVPGVPSFRDTPRLGTTWPGITSLVLFVLLILAVFAVALVRTAVSEYHISKMAKRRMKQGPERDFTLNMTHFNPLAGQGTEVLVNDEKSRAIESSETSRRSD